AIVVVGRMPTVCAQKIMPDGEPPASFSSPTSSSSAVPDSTGGAAGSPKQFEHDRALGQRMWIAGVTLGTLSLAMAGASAYAFSRPSPPCAASAVDIYTWNGGLCVSDAQGFGSLGAVFSIITGLAVIAPA